MKIFSNEYLVDVIHKLEKMRELVENLPRIILENHGNFASPHVGPWPDFNTRTAHVAAKPETSLHEPNFWCFRRSWRCC